MTSYTIGGRPANSEIQRADPVFVPLDGIPCADIGVVAPSVESFEDAWWPGSRFRYSLVPYFVWWEFQQMATITLNPAEAGLDVSIPLWLTNGSGVGTTGVVGSDVVVRFRSPDGTMSSPTVTWSEIDSTNSPGAYMLTVPTARFTMLGMWSLLVYPTVPGALFGVPAAVLIEIVSEQFPRIGPKFERLFRLMSRFLKREGVS